MNLKIYFMKAIEKFGVVLIIVVLLIITSSCSSDETSNNGSIMLKAKSTFNNFANKNEDSKSESVIDISSFKVNIKDIEFEIDNENENENEDDENENENENENEDSEFVLQGPFELDLSNGDFNIANIEIPYNVYEEIEFNLHKSTDVDSEMFGKSIEIKGAINGYPFVFWHDTEEEFEVDFDDSNFDVIVNSNSITLTINFDLNSIFGNYSSIDFSNLIDADADGVIEINPNNDDGNKELADFIINLLEEESELDDD